MEQPLTQETVWINCSGCGLEMALALKEQDLKAFFRHVQNGRAFCLGCGKVAEVVKNGGNA